MPKKHTFYEIVRKVDVLKTRTDVYYADANKSHTQDELKNLKAGINSCECERYKFRDPVIRKVTLEEVEPKI